MIVYGKLLFCGDGCLPRCGELRADEASRLDGEYWKMV